MNFTSQDSFWIFQHVLPSRDLYETNCLEMVSYAPNPLISAVDILVSESEVDQSGYNGLSFDQDHLSFYARIAWSLTYLATLDRQLLTDNPWILKHALLLQLFATDFLSTLGISSTSFGTSVSTTLLNEIINSVQLMTTYFFSDIASIGVPHRTLIDALNNSTLNVEGKSNQFILDICQASMASDTIQLARVARLVLQHVLRGASTPDIDLWLTFARQIRRKCKYYCETRSNHNCLFPIGLHTSESIVYSIILTGGETSMLSRFRNEVASDIIGIIPTQANTQGAQALRYLLILAPSPDSDIAFLPSQRAINLVQTIEKWVASDEDIDPEIESRTLALLCHLVPILQSISGGHWDLTFDLIESTLEVSCSTC
jgi:E3 ubiquitin-protein ligase listerin